MLHLVNANVPFLHRRILIQDIAESNEANRVHQMCSEFLSSLSANKELMQHRARERKSWTLACERENYGGLHEDSKLPLPFLVNARITECNSPVSKDYKKEMATFESGARAVCSKDNKEYILEKTITQQPERNKLGDESAEKKRRKDALEDDPTSNGQKERDSTSYWERRKRNNASAKRSRDARKAREMQTQIKAAFLERENLRIQAQLLIAQQENACLKQFLCAKM